MRLSSFDRSSLHYLDNYSLLRRYGPIPIDEMPSWFYGPPQWAAETPACVSVNEPTAARSFANADLADDFMRAVQEAFDAQFRNADHQNHNHVSTLQSPLAFLIRFCENRYADSTGPPSHARGHTDDVSLLHADHQTRRFDALHADHHSATYLGGRALTGLRSYMLFPHCEH